MSGRHLFRAIHGILVALAIVFFPALARAIPAFAQQTGQPCTACHIGAFGPQLTAFGRAFKISGYTQTGGDAAVPIPLSLMLLGSYSNTTKGQGGPAANNYGANGNFAMDQISLFLGGRINDYAGALIQGTFDGIASAFHLDNSDLRVTAPITVHDTELRLGLDINNGPTVQDPYNSSYAWGYPFVASALVPTPTAQPLLASGLIGNSVGATVYSWYDRSLYLEGGLYNTYGPSVLSWTGNAYGPGSTTNPAPYLRAAYEWNWNGQSAHVGGIFLHSNINPAYAPFSATGSFGHDSYTDYAVDGGYQYLGDGTNVVSLLGIVDHERQNLIGSFNSGAASQAGNSLNQARATLTYYYQQTYGLTMSWQRTWGSPNPLLFPAAPLSGSANGKPNSNALILEADWVPFGKADSWASPWLNLKLGVQYTIWTQFNGGTSNYDGFGRAASDNNTLYVFAWLIF
ncbi:MAG: hypothetical protein ABSA58_05195 [Acetobacteraceae bacterium]